MNGFILEKVQLPSVIILNCDCNQFSLVYTIFDYSVIRKRIGVVFNGNTFMFR